MSEIVVVCRNPECRNSLGNNPTDPSVMKRTGETFSAWLFACQTCGARRVVTKDQVGGTFGAGKTDTGRGKGLARYTPGGLPT